MLKTTDRRFLDCGESKVWKKNRVNITWSVTFFDDVTHLASRILWNDPQPKNIIRFRYSWFQYTLSVISVSYTHLDVYKRQDIYIYV